MHLLPVPKTIKKSDGNFILSQDCAIVLNKDLSVSKLDSIFTIAEKIETLIVSRPTVTKTDIGVDNPIYIKLEEGSNPDAYTLEINKNKIIIIGQGYSGIYYATQTFLQILRQSGRNIPCMKIDDAPDYKVRGYYFDIARGKIPSLEELYKMIDRFASYKINQFQLYIEHTFLFRQHTDIWAGANPITAEEIVRLDEYCQKRHIELVPALSAFGHFCTPLKSKRHQHLNELDIDASELPFAWWERIQGYTLNATDDESIELIGSMIDELAPLFTTNIFNICCDETWHLGKGKNKKLADKIGVGQLYCNFVEKLAKIVNKHNMRPMLWGDVILHHPELISELPKNAIVLNYDTANYDPKKPTSPKFKNANIDFYICVQLSTQNKFVGDFDKSTAGVFALAKEGFKYGAIGFLGNEWGDAGHINTHTNSLHGMILSATMSWNTNSYKDTEINKFDSSLSYLEFGDKTEKTVSVLRKIGKRQLITWHEMCFWVDSSIPQDWRNQKTNAPDSLVGIPNTKKIFKAYNEIPALYEQLADIAELASPKDKLAYQEMLFGVKGVSLLLEICLVTKKAAGLELPENTLTYYNTADKMRRFESDFLKLWHKRNRPSEYYRIQKTFSDIATFIEGFKY